MRNHFIEKSITNYDMRKKFIITLKNCLYDQKLEFAFNCHCFFQSRVAEIFDSK